MIRDLLLTPTELKAFLRAQLPLLPLNVALVGAGLLTGVRFHWAAM